jgi:hypothetical protein
MVRFGLRLDVVEEMLFYLVSSLAKSQASGGHA